MAVLGLGCGSSRMQSSPNGLDFFEIRMDEYGASLLGGSLSTKKNIEGASLSGGILTTDMWSQAWVVFMSETG